MKELYDLAYAFMNSKPWIRMSREELFAVALPDDQIGYCYLMGKKGYHMALRVHIGAEGFTTYRKLREQGRLPASRRVPLTQDCIQCSIEKQEQFSEEELEDLKAYCEDNDIPFQASFPQFVRFYPHCMPGRISKASDFAAIKAALQIVAELSRHVKKELELKTIAVHLDREEYIPAQGDHYGQPSMVMEEEPKEERVTIPLYAWRCSGFSVMGRTATHK